MRKKRSIVYVQPGKDVTLYVPADTPPQVVAYLNTLKENGEFSQGVMEILTQYVQGAAGGVQSADGESAVSAFETSPHMLEPGQLSTDEYLHADTGMGQDTDIAQAHAVASAAESTPEEKPLRQRLNLTQIFRQAQRNSGKLTDS